MDTAGGERVGVAAVGGRSRVGDGGGSGGGGRERGRVDGGGSGSGGGGGRVGRKIHDFGHRGGLKGTRRQAGESIQSMSGCVDHGECFLKAKAANRFGRGDAYAHESYFDIKINNIKRAPKVATPTGT